MPQKGYTSITLSEKIYNELKLLADKNYRSPAKELEFMLESVSEARKK